MTSRIAILICALLAIIGCSKKNSGYLPEATGKPGDIVVFIDSTQWKDSVGSALKKILNAEVPGLPRDEGMFNVINVDPAQKIYFLTEGRNLLYVFTLDKKTPGARALIKSFTPETIDRIKSDTSFYVYTDEDQFSRGQKIMYLFGDTEEHLIDHLEKNGQKIIDFFNKAERERLEQNLYKTNSNKGVSAFLRKEQQCEIRLPYGYKLADKQSDFIWFRKIEAEIDKDVFITWKPYESQYQLLPDSLIAWRDEVARKYLFEDPDNPISYLLTEKEVPFNPVRAQQVSFNGHYAMEIKGLWRTNNKSMGGPFVGYAMVDEPRGLLYYIEGFTYSPGKSQREIMRELETTLWTFRLSDQLSQ